VADTAGVGAVPTGVDAGMARLRQPRHRAGTATGQFGFEKGGWGGVWVGVCRVGVGVGFLGVGGCGKGWVGGAGNVVSVVWRKQTAQVQQRGPWG
jgi:hypothetical protein